MMPAADRTRGMFAAYARKNEITGLIEKHQMNIDMLQKTLDDPMLNREGRIGIKKKIYLLRSNMKVLFRMSMCRSSAFDRY